MVSLSLGGCRVRTREPLPPRTGSRVEISFEVSGVAFRFGGILAWTDGRNLAGIRFVDMIPRRKAELAEIIGEMEAVTAARADAVDLLVASQEAVPPAPSKENEWAAKQGPMHREDGARRSAAPAPDVPTDATAQTVPGSQPSDRRTHARHTVDNTAIIFLVKIGSALRGRIVDLSQSGCRIRTEERFPVGVFTRVETEFRLEGLSFRLGGVIQAIHDRNTVGIRFLDLSDRKRQQVAELIGEIQELRAAQMAAEAAPAQEDTAAG